MLTAIYIKGFKTFARPVRMPLEKGVTAIVGPNGSGKSNVTDAVLFALGEQSPGVLRAGGMGDVIFSGSEDLTPAAVAEVTLVLDNESGEISLPYREVSIARRITSDGETEYKINGSRCRLADVRSVAGEAGLGRHSILRQGAVDAIVAGGAASCRLALEEAAGLGVYRRRRSSASRRLERADTQLEKSRQLETELKDQLHRIEREAVAAREYRELESRYRRISLAHLHRIATQGLDDRRRELRSREKLVAELAVWEEGLRKQESELQRVLREIEVELRGVEEQLEGLEDLSEELRSESLRVDRVQFRLEAREGEGEQERIVSRLEAELHRVSGALPDLEAQAEDVEIRYAERQRNLDYLKEEASRRREERAVAERECARLSGIREKLLARRDKRTSEDGGRIPLGEEELERLVGLEQGLVADGDRGHGERCERLGVELEEHRRTTAEFGVEFTHRMGALGGLKGRIESRIRTLQSPGGARGVAPRLSEVIRARPGFETAVETALGEVGGGVLAENLREGIKLLDGVETVAVRLDAQRIDENGVSSGRPLVECVEVLEERYREAVERLLGGIYVVENPDAEPPSNGHVAVTRGGLRLTRTSIVRRDEEGRFTREARLARELERLQTLKKSPGELLHDLQETVSIADGRLVELEGTAERLRDLALRTDRSLALLGHEAGRRRNRAASYRQTLLEREKELEKLEADISDVEGKLVEAEATAERAHRELADVEEAAESRREEVRALDHRRTWLRGAVADGRKRKTEMSRELEHSRGSSDDEKSRVGSICARTAEVSRCLSNTVRRRRQRLRKRRSESSDAHRRASEERAEHSRRAVEVAGEVATARAAAERLAEELERIQNSSSAAVEELETEWGATLETARGEAETLPQDIESERQRLSRKIRRFGDVNLLALSQEGHLRERYEFVSAQRADAEAAANELNRIIQSIDREIESRFTDTFHRVRRAFGEIVPKMMHGASGRLELSEEGVEIGLRLGGRGWRPLRVLSGGERALLALSFLFSILMSRREGDTGPFCILDEAEAALDDVNLARFLAVVDSHRSGGQFLLVTHQKRTMAAADVLYGVTQDATGATAVVSKRLSGE